MAQLALDLAFRPAQGRDDYFVTPCNEEAVGWIDRWPDWPGVGLVVWGPPASGKSHLAAVWCARSAAPSVDLEALGDRLPPAILGTHDHLLLDCGSATAIPDAFEEPLLHLYNLIGERGGSLLATARTPLARWPVALPDLKSRLRAMASIAIAAPDDALLTAVLLKQLDDRRIRLPRDAVLFAVARMERSFEAARTLADRLDRAAYEQRRKPGLPLLREILDDDGSGSAS
jgi:chromosomal replication initiation ATPase DnaA